MATPAAAMAAEQAAKKVSAKIETWLSYPYVSRSNRKVRVKRKKGGESDVISTISQGEITRGDVIAILGLIGIYEAATVIGHGLANLNPAKAFEDVIGSVEADIVSVPGKVASGLDGTTGKVVSVSSTPPTRKLGPPTSQPSSVGGALQYHALRANARYTLWRQNQSAAPSGGTG